MVCTDSEAENSDQSTNRDKCGDANQSAVSPPRPGKKPHVALTLEQKTKNSIIALGFILINYSIYHLLLWSGNPGHPLPPQSPPSIVGLGLSGFISKVVEMTAGDETVAWRVTVINHSPESRACWLQVNILNRQGSIIDVAYSKKIVLPPDSQVEQSDSFEIEGQTKVNAETFTMEFYRKRFRKPAS